MPSGRLLYTGRKEQTTFHCESIRQYRTGESGIRISWRYACFLSSSHLHTQTEQIQILERVLRPSAQGFAASPIDNLLPHSYYVDIEKKKVIQRRRINVVRGNVLL